MLNVERLTKWEGRPVRIVMTTEHRPDAMPAVLELQGTLRWIAPIDNPGRPTGYTFAVVNDTGDEVGSLFLASEDNYVVRYEEHPYACDQLVVDIGTHTTVQVDGPPH